MSSAILRLFGLERIHDVEPKIKPKPAVLKDKLAEAEKNFARSCFANALACATVNAEARKVCQQSEEMRKATRSYDDQRKTHPVETPAFANCEYAEDPDEEETVCLHPVSAALKASGPCKYWETRTA